MLVHIDQPEIAERVHNGWLRTIEDGIHTYDIYTEGVSTEKVGTKEFACAVVARLGQKPNRLKPVSYSRVPPKKHAAQSVPDAPEIKKDLVGVDVFLAWESRDTNRLAESIQRASGDGLALTMISNRGVKVWPAGAAETFCTDSFQCRFISKERTGQHEILRLLQRVVETGHDIVKTEYLSNFDGQRGYSLAQGE